MSTIEVENGRNNTGPRNIHRIIYRFYLGHIVCVGVGVGGLGMLKGKKKSETQVTDSLQSSKTQDPTKKLTKIKNSGMDKL